ncbi:hypothetical protein ACFJIX_05345 [Roseateles sp. UC29_93]|uniref:hypothetical protein n=1 Tax=Roseateles sp. UC29_93 TaxID=3350177 RepID=UPI0036723AAA
MREFRNSTDVRRGLAQLLAGLGHRSRLFALASRRARELHRREERALDAAVGALGRGWGTGDYLVRLPSLIGRQIADQFCARVGDRLYGLCGLGIGDAKVFFAGGSSPSYETMGQVHAVLSAAFAVHGSHGEDIGRDPIRTPIFIPGALVPEDLAAETRGH